jgi:hypothetical protein
MNQPFRSSIRSAGARRGRHGVAGVPLEIAAFSVPMALERYADCTRTMGGGGGRRGGSVELDLDLIVDDADEVGLQIFRRRGVEHFAGPDVKTGGV